MIHEDEDNDAIGGNDDERAINNVVEEDDEEWICFLGGNSSSGIKKYQGSNSSDGGNTGDGVKIAGGVIGSGDEIDRIAIDRLPEPVNFSYAGYIAYQDIGKDECLAPGDDIEILLHHDPSTPMKSVASILEGFIDDPPFEENDDLFDLECKTNDWKRILYDAPIDKAECFDPGGDNDEIDAFLAIEVPTYIEEGYYDSEGDVLYLESLLSDDNTHNLSSDVFFDHEPQHIKNESDHDTLITFSPKSDPLHHEFVGGVITIPPRIVRKHEDYISRMSEEIDIFSRSDDSIPPGIESDFDSEEDIIDNLLNDDLIPEYERLTFDIKPDVPVINNVYELNEDECFDPRGGEINVEVDDSFTFVIRLSRYLTYPEVSPLLSSIENEDTIFDPGIFAFHFSSQEPVVRILQKSQENGQNRTNTDTGTDRVHKSRKFLAKGGDNDEIDAFLAIEVPTYIEEGYYDSEGDVLYLESLLSDDNTHNLSSDVFFDPEPQHIKNESDHDTLITFSPKSDPLHHEFVGGVITIPPRIEEIDIFSRPDDSIPPGIESDFDSEEDIIDNLLNDDPIPEYERLTFDIKPDVPVINNVYELNEDECFDPRGGEINVEVDDSFTFVIRLSRYLTYPEVSLLLSSIENEGTILTLHFAFLFSFKSQ
ncbi:hypothetical protein Tco_0564181 [Tanacetum coccineum]